MTNKFCQKQHKKSLRDFESSAKNHTESAPELLLNICKKNTERALEILLIFAKNNTEKNPKNLLTSVKNNKK